MFMKRGTIIIILVLAILITTAVILLVLFKDKNSIDIELPPCNEDLVNCDDFYNQENAQQAYDYCMNEVGSDVHRLDSDGDGIACESLG